MNLITSIWAKRGDEAEGADHAAGNTGAIAREDLASALAAHHEADLAELPEEERAEAVEVMVDSYIAARDVRTQTAAAIAEGAPADLAAEVAFAREYAGSSADDAERRVREYAASWGTPDRETTVRIARDAEMIHFAVGDVAAHEGYVTKRHADDAWTPEQPNGWTYQEVTGAHGRVLYEGPSEEKARAELDAWLVCDAPETGRCCYAHNPTGGR